MQNSSPQEIFYNIKKLRYADIDEEEFFDNFLSLTSVLCKSSASVFFEYNNSDINILSSYNNPSNQFINQSKDLIQKAIKQDFAYERFNSNDTQLELPFIVVFKNYNHNSVVALLVDKNSTLFNEILIRTQLINDIVYSYLLEYETDEEIQHIQTSSDIKNPLEMFNIIIHKKDFNLALLTLANELAYRFNSTTVSIGWFDLDKISTKAISFIESFEKNSDTIELLEELFEEVHLQNQVLIYPNDDITIPLYDSKKYCEYKNLSSVVSVPIIYEEMVVGVVVFEMIKNSLNTQQIETIKLILNQLSPWLETLYHKELPLYKRVYIGFVEFIENKLSIEYSGLKLVLTMIIFMIFLSLFVKIDYNIEATSALQTDYLTTLSAPYDGVVSDITVKEAQRVKYGDVVVKLDTNELMLKINETKANILKYTYEAEKERAKNSLADMKIALSKKEEESIKKERLEYYLSQSNIISPYDGVVVQAEYTKLLGAPVSKGDVLVKVSKIGSMYLNIKVKEEDIDNILDSGKFIFLSRPDTKYDIKIDKIIPIAKVDKSEGNVFVVKAFIKGNQEIWWRAGMSGIAKIDGGKKSIFWIATHKLVDFIKIHIWW